MSELVKNYKKGLSKIIVVKGCANWLLIKSANNFDITKIFLPLLFGLNLNNFQKCFAGCNAFGENLSTYA